MSQQPVSQPPMPNQSAPNPPDSALPTGAHHSAPPLPVRGGAHRLGAVPYFWALAGEPRAWWKTLVSLLSITLGMFVLGGILSIPVVVIEMMLGQRGLDDVGMSPGLLGVSLFSLALYIPMTLLLQRWLYGVRPLSSVAGRFRWKVLLLSFLPLLAFFAAYLGGTTFLSDEAGEARASTETVLYLAVTLILIPLQAAGEEYAFRGFAMRVVTAACRRSRFSVPIAMVVSSALFAAMHFASDPWLILYYFSFGIILAFIVHVTGGLEVAIAVHVANNLVSLVVAILLGQSLDMDRSMGTGSPVMLLMIAVLALLALVIWLIARRKPHLRAPMMNRGPSTALPPDARGLR
ncbi:CPBP family intramembrane glutamic endopeptidase [Propioniferax innocua]|uniref:Membrane protease YdiL (CAAX protease family) n=1 Tax=Propioniferax innocua TaxID=1753 RepID=A0A542ZTB7_9ACTN|nr:type II CAAX endopeptidase family protein [Propioniferax innocua]TQL63509.1 membrane protease YdiL (CAAX protease family) [Propioniferax innocua]